MPFPPLSGTIGAPLTDFEDASVSKLTLDRKTGGVVAASVALPATAGLLRFCSAFMADKEVGFKTPTLFVNEETNDIVDVPPGAPYGPDPAIAPQRQGGYVAALDTKTGEYTTIPGLGRYNHENTIVVPGRWKKTVALLSTDDTFDGPSSQLYLYLARKDTDVIKDKGHLYALRITAKNGARVDRTDPQNGANDYLDLGVGDRMRGEFIRVPDAIADGTTGVAPQQALEDWSNANNVFQFIRLEDLATDPDHPRTVYIADTGRSRVVPDPVTGRAKRGPSGTVGQADNGSVFKLVFNKRNPRLVDSLTVLAQGDDATKARYVPFVSPDNVGVSDESLMIQEDKTDARIWRYDFDTHGWTVVAHVTGDKESSGIVDASKWFGRGAWFVTVQDHGTFQTSQVVTNPMDSTFPDLTIKREAGQLILVKIPGS